VAGFAVLVPRMVEGVVGPGGGDVAADTVTWPVTAGRRMALQAAVNPGMAEVDNVPCVDGMAF
jgi:hypothetical protein